ncbi:hypothetical protein KCU81_g44, partial [Aureobasidium melanogenum]
MHSNRIEIQKKHGWFLQRQGKNAIDRRYKRLTRRLFQAEDRKQARICGTVLWLLQLVPRHGTTRLSCIRPSCWVTCLSYVQTRSEANKSRSWNKHLSNQPADKEQTRP